MRFNISSVLGLAAFLGFASAQDSGSNPSGNPINLPASDSLVTAGTPFEIKWQPTTTGPVTIHLLKGPTTNLVDLGPIASHIDNSGSFSWTPSTSLQDSASMPKGDKYGLKLVVDATGQYQYSMPFDIKSSYSGAAGSGSSSIAVNTTSTTATSAVDTSVPTTIVTYTSATNVAATSAASTVTYVVGATLTAQVSPTGGSTGTKGNVSNTASPSAAATANSAVAKSVGTGLFLAGNLFAALLLL